MNKKVDRSDYFRSEASFLLKTIDLRELMEDYGYEFDRRESTQKQPVYKRGDRKLTVRIGSREGFWIWCDLKDFSIGGKVTDFLMMEKMIDVRGAYDMMREIARSKHGVDYKVFQDSFSKLQDAGKTIQNTQANVIKKPASHIFKMERYLAEREKDDVKEFQFKPAENFDFFLDRGISKETLDHPLFKGKFGNASGAFGSNEQRPGQLKADSFVFNHHIIVPYWDVDGKIIALEAKNRFTEEAFLKEINREIQNGGNPRKVRRNPSKFYVGASKDAAWISNIPEAPQAIHICEQPADSLSYFQLNRNNPLIEKTIFLSTGGPLVQGHYAILHKLIKDHNIKKIITGFDQDLSGLRYSLTVIQNLPFNDVEKQKYDVVFRSSSKHEFEIDFVLKRGGGSESPSEILSAIKMIERSLNSDFRFEGGFEFLPALTQSDRIATLSIPFVPENIAEIVRLSQILLKTQQDNVQVEFPKIGNDWNDELRGIPMANISASQLLYDQPENRDKIFITQNNAVLYHQRFTSFDHNIKEIIGQLNPFAQHNFVKPVKTLIPHKFLLDSLKEAQREYQLLIPPLKDAFVNAALKHNIVYTPLTAQFTKAGVVLATLKENEIEISSTYHANDQEKKVLEWMTAAIQAGKDPNKTDLRLDYNTVLYNDQQIGTVTPWLTFQENEQFTTSKLGNVGMTQLNLLMEELSSVRSRWQLFREKFPEPIFYYGSNNLVFEENKTPIFKFVPEKNRLELLADEDKIQDRNFNPFFYKALQLFVENKGVFHNYLRLMRVNPSQKTIYYNTPDHEIGRLIEDNKKIYFALYPDVPETMKREVKVLGPYPEATQELIKKYNVTLEPSGLNAKIKESAISRIPLSHLRYYEGKKFNTLSEEKIKSLTPSAQALYSEAYLWHLNHLGSPRAVIGNERDKVYEKDGDIYFNRIKIGRYNTDHDKIEFSIKPGSEFYQYISILEKNLVKDPANREYSQYLLQPPSHTPEKFSKEQINGVLTKIELNEATGKFQLVDENFLLKNIGFLEGKKMIMNEEFMNYSPLFKEAISFFSEKQGYQLEWKNLEEKEAIKTSFSSIEIPEKQNFEHKLLVNDKGLLLSIPDSPIFEDKIRFNRNGEMEFLFLPNREGQLIMPFGADWVGLTNKHFWMSKQVDNPTTLVLAQTPDQAALYYQYNLPESLNEKEIFMSMLNYSAKDGRVMLENLVSTLGLKHVRLIGEEDFLMSYGSALNKIDGISSISTPLITVDQSKARISALVSGHEPDPGLQVIARDLSGHNLMNPSEGLLLFPMKSTTAHSHAVLGSKLMLSRDVDAMWYSRPLKNSSRVVLISNPEEAVYYMKLNQGFVKNDTIISFQNEVTSNQVKMLMDQLNVPRFHSRVVVVNTNRLNEQLQDHKFKIATQIEKPLRETTFRAEFHGSQETMVAVRKDIQMSRKRILTDENNILGNYNAPVISQNRTQEHQTKFKL